MNNNKAIPEGYMTVGEIAKKMGVTVRTLQYYHKEGLLSPSAESEGGRRLYTNKDIVKLHQIQSMKYLGFSLEDIKNKLPSINTPQEVSAALTAQAQGVRESIKSLKEVLSSIEKLNAEVLQIDEVNWLKYADIISMLQTKESGHWLMKYQSQDIADKLRFNDEETGTETMKRQNNLIKKMANLQAKGTSPESDEAKDLAKQWWEHATIAANGDMTLVSGLIEMGKNVNEDEWKDNFSFDKEFLESAMRAYFRDLGINPFDS